MKKLLVIPGSIRQKSYNKAASRAVKSLSVPDLEVEIFELDNLPMFNEDLEGDLPIEVDKYVNAVANADAILFSTPEYNNMMPGVLKNACEWLTRPYSGQAVKDKPVAIMGASTGGFGTVRAQNQLLLLCQIMGFETDASLRLPISSAQNVFNPEGKLTDPDIREKLSDLVNRLMLKVE